MASDEPKPARWSLAVTPLPKSTELGDEVDVVMLSGEQRRVRVVDKNLARKRFLVRFINTNDSRAWEIPIADE